MTSIIIFENFPCKGIVWTTSLFGTRPLAVSCMSVCLSLNYDFLGMTKQAFSFVEKTPKFHIREPRFNLGSACDYSCLLIQALGSSGDSLSRWIPAIHVADLDWVLSSWLQRGSDLAIAGIWGVSHQTGVLSLCLSVSLSFCLSLCISKVFFSYFQREK